MASQEEVDKEVIYVIGEEKLDVCFAQTHGMSNVHIFLAHGPHIHELVRDAGGHNYTYPSLRV